MGLMGTILGALGMLAIVGAAPAVGTSCAGTGSIAAEVDGGGVVFVGTVVSTTNRGRWATFAVEEVWSGGVADTQVVKGGLPPQPDTGSFSGVGGEHTYEPGVRYLVDATVPTSTGFEAMYADEDHPFEPGDLTDNPCSQTTTWSDALAVDRPASARTIDRAEPIAIVGALPDPKPAGSHGASRGTIVLVAAAIMAIAGLCLYLLFRRGSIADRARTDVPDPGAESEGLSR